MKLIPIILSFICVCLPLSAQKNNTCSHSDFMKKKQAYLAEKAGLTEKEAAEFFPIYFKLQELKKENDGKAWQIAKKVNKDKQASESDYEEAIKAFIEADQKNAELDKIYLKKGSKIIPASKIFKIIRAEIMFNRNMLKIIHPKQNDKK